MAVDASHHVELNLKLAVAIKTQLVGISQLVNQQVLSGATRRTCRRDILVVIVLYFECNEEAAFDVIRGHGVAD